ncbi:ABC transporter ATP-binding protein [Flavobacterium sp.]|uniref:ABC transporter ATP-binding protein n=1 Tax=Flavobacterium sp. TaxID=239 RepID=UPI00286DA103|nr:ABC transporter ATP-binding protein [Flavobacterium sp.]
MNEVILKVENISKQYRLGEVGTGTISHDLNRWWAKIRRKEDPFLKIGETNDRSKKGSSDYVWALQDINFEVNRGEVVGIIGKNGAGKSTLLKILSRVTSPTTGSIKTRGRIASLLEVGTGFHPEMTGRENIYLNGAILGMTKKEITSKIDEIIEFSGCERYIDTPVKRYSSGMTVRLAFAVAAHLDPEILVVDEVLAVGDAEFQKKAIGKMQDMSQDGGRTVLFVSHNMAAVQNLCQRGIVMRNGKVFFQGNIEDSIQNYLKDNSTFETLSSYDNRIGSGVIKVIGASIYGESKNLKPQVGRSFHIELDIENPQEINSSQIFFDLKIDDQMGQRIAWLSNTIFNKELQNNVCKIIFKIDKLNLNHGGYYISTDVYVDRKRADWLQSAIYFEVIDGEYYNTGRDVPVSESRVLFDFDVNFY